MSVPGRGSVYGLGTFANNILLSPAPPACAAKLALKGYGGAVYVDVSKVASSSIKYWLAAQLGLDCPSGNPHEVRFLQPPPADLHGDRFYPDLFTFAFIRNPWDRLVSCYRDKIGGEVSDFTRFTESGVARCLANYAQFEASMSFSAFVEAVASIPDADSDEHFRSQAYCLCNAEQGLAVDYLGHFESLESYVAVLSEQLGLDAAVPLPRLQAAPEGNFRQWYTEDTWDLVAQRYTQDVALFEAMVR